MNSNHFEDKLKIHANEIFGQEKELPAGHRERFEQRLKDNRNARSWRGLGGFFSSLTAVKANWSSTSWIITTAAAAAILAGVVFLSNPSTVGQQEVTLAAVRSYYSIRLEEEAEATRHLIQQVDVTNREILLKDVELIAGDPLPEVQMSDDDYIVLIADFYAYKIEILQNLQSIIIENI